MAGQFSFLSNNPPTRAKDSKTQPKPRADKITPLSPQPERKRSASDSSAGLEKVLKDSEDEWYSCSSSEGQKTPIEKTNNADDMDSFSPPSQVPSADREELMRFVPALFGSTLPPCGLEIQVAYENICARLRWRWIENRGQKTALDICHVIKGELDRDERIWPVMTNLRFTKKRKPWRRENVFRYELRWIKYFIREAQAQAQSSELMTESEKSHENMNSPVPPELGFNISRSDIIGQWNTWNEMKRLRTPAVPGGVETGAKKEGETSATQVDKTANGTGETSTLSTEDSKRTISSTPSKDDAGDKIFQTVTNDRD